MALVGNGVRLATSNPMRQMGAASAGVVERSQWSMPGPLRNFDSGSAAVSSVTDRAGLPNGHRHPSAWVQPQKSGTLGSFNEIGGSGSVSSANLAGGLYGEADLVGSGSLASADMRLLIWATAALSCSSAVSADVTGKLEAAAALIGSGAVAAGISSVVQITADLLGNGDVTAASIAGVLQASADLLGTGDVTDANLAGVLLASAALSGSGALAVSNVVGAMSLSAGITASGSLSAGIAAVGHIVAGILAAGSVDADIRADAAITCDITSFSELSPQSLAAAVWNSLVSQFQGAGTMGEALSTAGSGGLSPTQQTMLTELYRLAGLDPTKPLVVTSTTRDAGDEISQSISESGGTVTVTRT